MATWPCPDDLVLLLLQQYDRAVCLLETPENNCLTFNEDNDNNLIMIMNTPATGDGVYFANYHETPDPVKIFEEPEKYLLLTTGWGCGCCGGRRGSAA